ncbi:hypothetical protein ABIC20_005050 [Methylobacterium radiotolerans]|uniref:Uncharacterized protein n=1 Tax=Methylobacterium radiotolerans TaxID=31998 RepID=A0ABV2NMQ3_9HYPH
MVGRPRPRCGSTRATRTRENRSAQVSSGATRSPAPATAAARASRSVPPPGATLARRSIPAKRSKASARVRRSGSAKGSVSRPRKAKQAGARGLGRAGEQVGAVRHQRRVGGAGPVPLEHRELGMVQRPALAVAEHPGDAEQPRLARGQELLAGEFRRGVQVERRAGAARPDGFRGEGRQMRLVAGRDLQAGGLGLDEVAVREPPAERREDAVAQEQRRAPVGVATGRPPGGGGSGHDRPPRRGGTGRLRPGGVAFWSTLILGPDWLRTAETRRGRGALPSTVHARPLATAAQMR